MAKIGKRDLNFTREREVDNTEQPIAENARITGSAEQDAANQAAADRFLASEKNIKVMEVAATLAEENGTSTFIQVPLPGALNYTPLSSAAHEALKAVYGNESRGGRFIYWSLFKHIIDKTLISKSQTIEELFGPLSEDEFSEALNEIDTGALAVLLQNPNSRVEDFVNYDPNTPKDPTKSLLLQLGVATLSIKLLSQLEKVRKKDSVKDDTEEERRRFEEAVAAENSAYQAQLKTLQTLSPRPPASTGESNVDAANNATYQTASGANTSAIAQLHANHEARLLELGVKKASRFVTILTRVAKAVALLALIHGLSREDAQSQWKEQVAPNVDDDLAEEFETHMLELYDNPDEEIQALLADPQDNPDRVIMDFVFDYMEKNNGKGTHNNFTPWIVYASAAIKDVQMNDLNNSLKDTTNFEPITVKRQHRQNIVRTVSRGTGTNNLRREGINSTLQIPVLETSKYVPDKMQEFFSKLPGGGKDKTLSVNIMDYVDMTKEVSGQSSETSNYFMKLMQNNKYTPELVCCLINFLLKRQDVSIGDAKDFLKSIKAVMHPVQFNYGRLFQDIVNRLFGDLKSKLLSYSISQLTKFFEKIKSKIYEWMIKIDDEEHYLIFCSPLIDIMAAVVHSLNHLQDALETFLEELADYFMSFEVKLEEGVVSLYGANRNRMLADLIESLLNALDTGKLCKYNARQPSDIHPDALDIIDKNSSQPNSYLSNALQDFDSLVDQVEDSANVESSVRYFADPKDPAFAGGVSIHRQNDGLSAISSIIKYAADCNSMKDSDRQDNILVSTIG